jgi:ABC-type transport system involved in multi-copper enzyme maturation permease subunit
VKVKGEVGMVYPFQLMQLNTIKIKIGIAEYKAIIEAYQQQMASHLKAIEDFEDRFDRKIKNAKIYPDWAVVIFIICLIVTVTLSSYFFLR